MHVPFSPISGQPSAAPALVKFGYNTLYVLDFDNTIAHTQPGDWVDNDESLVQEFDNSDVVVVNTGRPFADMMRRPTQSLLSRL